jgi:hypothetical protein
LIGTAAAGVETGRASRGAAHGFGGQQRDGGSLDPGQIIHEVVEQRERPGVGILQDPLQPALGLAGEQRHSHRRGALQIGVSAIEHTERAGDMKAADRHRDVSLTQRPGEVERARELVRLNSDQHHHAGAGGADHRGKTIAADARIGLVKRMNVDFDIRPEHAPLGAILRETVERSERSRRYRRTQPLDDIAIVVVMRRLH